MMKKVLSLLALAAGLASLNAQSEASSPSTPRQHQQTEATATIPRSIYAEGLGHSISILALHYEQRFKPQRNGWGWRVGLGYSFQSNAPYFSLPVGVNYLMGHRRHYFELGAGLTPLLVIGGERDNGYGLGHSKHVLTVTETELRLFVNGTVGYRYQPLGKGFSFGAGLSPIAYMTSNSLHIHPFYPYLRVGYTF